MEYLEDLQGLQGEASEEIQLQQINKSEILDLVNVKSEIKEQM